MFDHRAHEFGLQIGVFVGIGDDGRVAFGGQRHLQNGGEFGEERIAQIVDDKTHKPRRL